MIHRQPSSSGSTPIRLLLIAAIDVLIAAAFAYTAGWLTPARLTPDKLVDTLAPPTGPALGFRRAVPCMGETRRRVRVDGTHLHAAGVAGGPVAGRRD